MAVINLHASVETTNHLFEDLAQFARDYLRKHPEYEYATFECEGVLVPVYQNTSMEAVRADFSSARADLLRGRPRRRQ